MAQPTFTHLFGEGATYNPTTNNLEISKGALESAGIANANLATPIEILGAITKNAHAWLNDNTDETVNSASRLEVTSPFFRNGVSKVNYAFSLQFFGTYTTPIFDPDDL